MYEALYAENEGLLVKMVQQYAPYCKQDRAISPEDLSQTGFLALVRAAQSYDPKGGKTWASWAVWHIQREFDTALGMREGRFTKAHSVAAALDRPMRDENGEEVTPADLLADESLAAPDAELLLDELRRGVRRAVDRLEDERQRQAVRLCRLEERSYRQAAAAMGVSERRVRKLNRRAEAALARDRQLRRLADLDERTRFHAHKGVAAFNRDWTSVTEGAALWRIEQAESMQGDDPA